MSLLVRQLARCNKLLIGGRDSGCSILPATYLAARNITFMPTVFDTEADPGPKFFAPDVQTLLKRLTRPDFSKVFRKRTNRSRTQLKTPKYKFLTTEQLEEEIDRAQNRADELLQMPPVVKIRQAVDKVLSRDPALIGVDKAKFVFTDISFGFNNDNRIIVERDLDGTLRYSDHDTRKRLNQAYFPISGRKIKDPPMFTEDDKLTSLLDREQYEFVLDRACIQYEPDDPQYQRVTSIVYQHVDFKKNYNLIRSTRHFGPLTFYLVWHRSMDGLLLELLQSGQVREAACLLALRHSVHGDLAQGELAQELAKQILPTPIQPPTYETMTEADVELDNKCMDCIARYIANNSAMKGMQELALQAFRETHQQQVELSRGLRKAHGTS